MKRDPVSLAATYVPDKGRRIDLQFFGKGEPYRFWGLFPTTTHFLVPTNPRERFFLLGADRLGRDMLSRLIYGTRISMSIGLVGVALSLILGVVLGGISGYYGGWIDYRHPARRRVHPLAADHSDLAGAGGGAAGRLAAAHQLLRHHASSSRSSAGPSSPVSCAASSCHCAPRTSSWRRGSTAAGEMRLIFRHMLPSFASHLIASVTLAIPLMILAETGLSFLGLGLQPPTISWGVLLKEAQNIRSIATAPWLFLPGVAVIVAVLALNFLGDGLRDAADPYEH